MLIGAPHWGFGRNVTFSVRQDARKSVILRSSMCVRVCARVYVFACVRVCECDRVCIGQSLDERVWCSVKADTLLMSDKNKRFVRHQPLQFQPREPHHGAIVNSPMSSTHDGSPPNPQRMSPPHAHRPHSSHFPTERPSSHRSHKHMVQRDYLVPRAHQRSQCRHRQ